MKTFIAAFLFLAIAIQLTGNLITVAAYEMNKEYIAKNLCINKNKPKSHCNGKCHLMKELQKEEKKNDRPCNSMKDKIETVQFFESSIESNFVNESKGSIIDIIYLESKTFHFENAIFHPPLV